MHQKEKDRHKNRLYKRAYKDTVSELRSCESVINIHFTLILAHVIDTFRICLNRREKWLEMHYDLIANLDLEPLFGEH